VSGETDVTTEIFWSQPPVRRTRVDRSLRGEDWRARGWCCHAVDQLTPSPCAGKSVEIVGQTTSTPCSSEAAFNDDVLLKLQTEPEPVRDRRLPLSILIPPRNLAPAIILGVGEDQSDSAAIGPSFGRTYFEATGEAHDYKYENCRLFPPPWEEMVFPPNYGSSGPIYFPRHRIAIEPLGTSTNFV